MKLTININSSLSN